MSLARGLWADNTDLAQAALDHPFVRGLRAGTLPRHHFQAYLAQDAYFLDAFACAYALALAHSPEQQGRRDFFELLAGVLEERRLHEGYAARWEVHLSSVTPMEATQAYTDFLLATAALQGVGETCAAMTPCMRLYAFVGQSLAADHPDETHPYVERIRTYADPSFKALAVRLESLLDRYASATPRVQSVYRRAMALELDFFTAHTPAGR